MKDITLQGFLDSVASTDPTQGGGCVSAVSGSMGVSLMLMVARLMASKEKFAQEHDTLHAMIETLETVKQLFLDYAQQDSLAFDLVMQAYRLPKETPQEKLTRAEAIEQALIKASLVPLQVMQRVVDVAVMMDDLLSLCPASFYTDALVGKLMLIASFDGAKMNVLINLDSLKDPSQKQQIEQKVNELTLQWDYFKQRFEQHK